MLSQDLPAFLNWPETGKIDRDKTFVLLSGTVRFCSPFEGEKNL